MLALRTQYPDVVVKANRKIRDNWRRRLGSLLYNLECRVLFDLPSGTSTARPKVFPRAFGKLLELRRDDDLIDAEFSVICRREGYPMFEVPASSRPPRRQVDDQLRLGREDVRGRVRAATRSAAMSADAPTADAVCGAATTPAGATRRARCRRLPGAAGRPAAAARARHAARGGSCSPRAGHHAARHARVRALADGAVASATGASLTYLPLPHPSGMAVDREPERGARRQHAEPEPGLRPRARARDFLPRPTAAPPASPTARWCRSDRGSSRRALHARPGLRRRPSCTPTPSARMRSSALDERRRPRAGLVAALHRTRRAARFLPQPLPAQLDRRRRTCDSFFSASADAISARRPGHRNFPVDGRGVIFSGATREPFVRGLTRPHSARLHAGRSGSTTAATASSASWRDGRLRGRRRLPGWTRGLCFSSGVAFVGTSRVIPRFRQYAPGLDVEERLRYPRGRRHVGRVLGSLTWPVRQSDLRDRLDRRARCHWASRSPGRRGSAPRESLFYSFDTDKEDDRPMSDDSASDARRHV